MSRYYIVIDTEAASETGKCNPSRSLVYDIGYHVVEASTGANVASRSIAVMDTFHKTRLMRTAYYACKLPQYYEGMRDGTWECMTFAEAHETWCDDVARYVVRDVWAWNVDYDRRALGHTIGTYSGGLLREWDASVNYLDIQSVAARTLLATAKYRAWCDANDVHTPSGYPPTTAEAAYKYLTGRMEFEECHTALEDATIEASMLRRLMRCKRGTYKWGAKHGLMAPRR